MLIKKVECNDIYICTYDISELDLQEIDGAFSFGTILNYVPILKKNEFIDFKGVFLTAIKSLKTYRDLLVKNLTLEITHGNYGTNPIERYTLSGQIYKKDTCWFYFEHNDKGAFNFDIKFNNGTKSKNEIFDFAKFTNRYYTRDMHLLLVTMGNRDFKLEYRDKARTNEGAYNSAALFSKIIVSNELLDFKTYTEHKYND